MFIILINKYLYCANYIPDLIQIASILLTILRDKYYFYLHFTGKKPMAHRVKYMA